jgi:hypothetical protein
MGSVFACHFITKPLSWYKSWLGVRVGVEELSDGSFPSSAPPMKMVGRENTLALMPTRLSWASS